MKKFSWMVCGALAMSGLLVGACGSKDDDDDVADTGDGDGDGDGDGVGGTSGDGDGDGAGGMSGDGDGDGAGGSMGGMGGENMGGMGGAMGCGEGPFEPVVNYACADIPSVKEGSEDFTITTEAFDNCGEMPAENTCDGNAFGTGTSPELTISGAPEGTMSFALVFADIAILAEEDPARERFGYHSVMWDIPADTMTIPAGTTGGYESAEIPGALQWSGRNEYAWFPPCGNPFPVDHPAFEAVAMCGLVTDSYAFRLYALSEENLTDLPAPDMDDDGNPTGNWVVNMAHYVESLDALAVTEYRGTSSAWASSFAPPDPVEFPCVDGETDGCLMPE